MWIQLSSGRGPEECEYAVYLYWTKYLQPLLKKEGCTYEMLEKQTGTHSNSYKSMVVFIEETEELYAALQGECGTVQWTCESVYRKHHKRKNWFFQCAILSSAEKLMFSENDVVFETTRGSGPGGQHRNKVETAVRATHVPTGITVFASEERSQQQNKKLALGRLNRKIKDLNTQIDTDQSNEKWSKHNNLVRGNARSRFKGPAFKKM